MGPNLSQARAEKEKAVNFQHMSIFLGAIYFIQG